MSEMQLRGVLRYSHIGAGVILGVIIWTPLIDNSAALWFARLGLLPVLVLAGGWMWLQSRGWASRRPASET
jgi:hypothetical protein